MGLMSAILGGGSAGAVRQVGQAVTGVAEVFVGNRANREAADSRQYLAAVGEFGAEFASAGSSGFDRFVNGLNRLPRPLLALGTLALFGYAMTDPPGFSTRMQGLNLVPEPLWWLLGAIVSFYFGARELHHQRSRTATVQRAAVPAGSSGATSVAPAPVAAPIAQAAPVEVHATEPDFNAAVEEWRRLSR